MSRTAALALLLVLALPRAGLAQAPAAQEPAAAPQEPAPPVTTSPEPVAPAAEPVPPAAEPAPPAAVGPSETPAARSRRYSRASAGPGGPLLIFTEVVSGLVTGAMVGGSDSTDSETERRQRFLGAFSAGAGLGTAAAVYQYYNPVERNEAFLVAGGAFSGFLLGAGLGEARGSDASDRSKAWTVLLTTQLGVASTLAATALTPGDVKSGDGAFVGMSALYAAVLTGLVTQLVDNTGDTSAVPLLVAPSAGMALGALLAGPGGIDMAPGRVLKLTLLPLGTGLVIAWVGSGILDDGESGDTLAATTLVGIGATFALTWLFTGEPPAGSGDLERDDRRPAVRAAAVPVLMSAGRGRGLAAGPGLFVQF